MSTQKLDDDPVVPVGNSKITVERELNETQIRAVIREINAELEEAHGQIKGVLKRAINNILPNLSLLYDNKAYKKIGYGSWGACIDKEIPLLANYGRSYQYLLGDIAIAQRDLLESAPDNGIKHFLQQMPISQKTELLTIPDVGMQTAAIQMAVQFASSFGPDTGVTAAMISAAVQTVKQIALTGGKVDTGDGSMKSYEAAMHLEYDKIVGEAVERNKKRLGVSEWETVWLDARIVSFPQGASNYVVLQLAPGDFDDIANMPVGSILPVKVKRQKPPEQKK